MLLALVIGFFGGLRALTPPAIVAWAAFAGWLQLDGALGWMSSWITALLFTALATAELVADKLPSTPSRTAPPGLGARLVLGALCGACVATAGGASIVGGALLGAIGGIAGCFAGYAARTRLAGVVGSDLPVAMVEDLVAVAGALFVVSRF